MKERPQQSRQLIGCGYEPPPGLKLLPLVQSWDHAGRDRQPDELDETGRVALPVCPGYACSLPEVIEATWAYTFLDKGSLDQFCGGQATDLLLEHLKIYGGERSRCATWEARNPEKP